MVQLLRLLELSLFLLLLSLAAPPASLTEQALLDELAKSPGLTAQFREEKRIAILAAPLVTEGTVDFVPPSLLVRRTTSPSVSTMRLDGTSLEIERGGKTERIDLDAAPAVRPFADAFAGILRGDLAALQKSFEVELVPSRAREGAWKLVLVPSKGRLAKIIRTITVEGRGVVVERLVVTETSGDESVTTFEKVDAAHRHSAEERSALRARGVPAPSR